MLDFLKKKYIPRHIAEDVCLCVLLNIPLITAGTACVAKAWSIAFDSLTGNHISQALEGTFSPYMPSALGTFPDFVVLGPLLLITGEKGSVIEE